MKIVLCGPDSLENKLIHRVSEEKQFWWIMRAWLGNWSVALLQGDEEWGSRMLIYLLRNMLSNNNNKRFDVSRVSQSIKSFTDWFTIEWNQALTICRWWLSRNKRIRRRGGSQIKKVSGDWWEDYLLTLNLILPSVWKSIQLNLYLLLNYPPFITKIVLIKNANLTNASPSLSKIQIWQSNKIWKYYGYI